MKSRTLFRGLSYPSWINSKTVPPSVRLKAFLRKPKDVDGLSVFDAQECCNSLNVSGVAEIALIDVLMLQDPVTGAKLRACYDTSDDPHHLVLDGVPFAHEHPAEADTLAINLALKAKLLDSETTAWATKD
jgi:hypothetical protein